MTMSAFILDYGTEAHGHVEWDQGLDVVKYWPPGAALPAFEGPIDGFALQYPDIVLEMRTNRVIRLR